MEDDVRPSRRLFASSLVVAVVVRSLRVLLDGGTEEDAAAWGARRDDDAPVGEWARRWGLFRTPAAVSAWVAWWVGEMALLADSLFFGSVVATAEDVLLDVELAGAVVALRLLLIAGGFGILFFCS